MINISQRNNSYRFLRNSIYVAAKRRPKGKRCGSHIFMNETRVINCDTSCGLNGNSLRMSSVSQHLFSLGRLRCIAIVELLETSRYLFQRAYEESPDLFIYPTQRERTLDFTRAVESGANFV